MVSLLKIYVVRSWPLHKNNSLQFIYEMVLARDE